MYADPETIIGKLDAIENKHLSPQFLIPYGFGDGGGGPGYKMIEYAQKIARMPYLPKVKGTKKLLSISRLTWLCFTQALIIGQEKFAVFYSIFIKNTI